jgi:hypothetical protein
MIITPILTSVATAFLPSYRWTKHETRARRRCRVALRILTLQVGARYAQEQSVAAQSDGINRHWRQQ